MFYNLLKGEMKLVGVRPLTEHYFSLYRKKLQELRAKTKPGLIPPFYLDMPIIWQIHPRTQNQLQQFDLWDKAILNDKLILLNPWVIMKC